MKKNNDANKTLFSEMTDEEMKNLLLELHEMPHWQAIVRFNRIKDAQIINSLFSADPFKDPTTLARTQGIRIGTYYLEQQVVTFLEEVKEANKKAEEEKIAEENKK